MQSTVANYYAHVHAPSHAIYHTFMEIQNGPNPLTPKEIRALINKRPHVYGCLEAWAEKEFVVAPENTDSEM